MQTKRCCGDLRQLAKSRHFSVSQVPMFSKFTIGAANAFKSISLQHLVSASGSYGREIVTRIELNGHTEDIVACATDWRADL